MYFGRIKIFTPPYITILYLKHLLRFYPYVHHCTLLSLSYPEYNIVNQSRNIFSTRVSRMKINYKNQI